MDEIKQWLENDNRSFEEGLGLFQKYSRKRAVFLYLMRKQDMVKLVYELEQLSKLKVLTAQKVLPVMPKMPTAKSAAKKDSAPADDNETHKVLIPNRIKREDLPEDLQLVYDEIATDYKHQRVFHEKMKLAKTDEERADFRKGVVQFDDAIAAGWNLIDEELEKRKAGPSSETGEKNEVPDAAKISQQINTARSAISRALKANKFDAEKLQAHIQVLIDNQAPVNADTRQKLIELNAIKKESNLLVK